MRLEKRGRFWAVYDSSDALVCLTVYKKGGAEVIHRLTSLQAVQTEAPCHRECPEKASIKSMPQLVSFTIGTGNKVSSDWQSQDAHLSITYEAEDDENDIFTLIEHKSSELEAAHSLLWRRIREIRAEKQAKTRETNGASQDPAVVEIAANTADTTSGNGRRRTARTRSQPASNGVSPTANAPDNPAQITSQNGAGPVQSSGPIPELPAPLTATVSNDGEGTTAAQASPPSHNLFPIGNGAVSAPPASTAQDYVDAPSDPMMKAIQAMIRRVGYSEDDVVALLAESYGKVAVEELNRAEAANMLGVLQRLSRETPQSAVAA